ncbi:MAG: PhzF family phenazine biosynthesis protein [Stigonema ocellatum SAG 48.90 = DSM 106950]|nr:PhzF family phenazine biosynthesis protein [Stigonema ocellatum SAG 48.90 = DSM 106950]
MKQIKIFQIDAFASVVFRGNPAAICPLTDWLSDELMQAIAAENNLAETAFFTQNGDNYDLRWFTPRCEVDLCGHATLASAFVIFTYLEPARNSVQFNTRSGPLWVKRNAELLTMDFPSLKPTLCTNPPALLVEGLGKTPQEVLSTKSNYLSVFASEEEVRAIQPDFRLLEQLHPHGVIVTALSKNADFVSRYFAPSYGVPEDPVTGSIHCSLVPYWANRLGKTQLYGKQVSNRGGELWCEAQDDRVSISGHAVRYFEGEIYF